MRVGMGRRGKGGMICEGVSASSSGDKVWISDPQGTFDDSRLQVAEKIVMIAAGSGNVTRIFG